MQVLFNLINVPNRYDCLRAIKCVLRLFYSGSRFNNNEHLPSIGRGIRRAPGHHGRGVVRADRASRGARQARALCVPRGVPGLLTERQVHSFVREYITICGA